MPQASASRAKFLLGLNSRLYSSRTQNKLVSSLKHAANIYLLRVEELYSFQALDKGTNSLMLKVLILHRKIRVPRV